MPRPRDGTGAGGRISRSASRAAHPARRGAAHRTQIAEALEAAHEQGIIHRDSKPANIKVRAGRHREGLDFGLAKLRWSRRGVPAERLAIADDHDARDDDRRGVILGTAAYMAPEQAKGRPADKRSDVWAFGCVLYEMLTGARAFAGDDVSDTLAAVLRAEPDWRTLPPETPASIRRLLRRCLERIGSAASRMPPVRGWRSTMR